MSEESGELPEATAVQQTASQQSDPEPTFSIVPAPPGMLGHEQTPVQIRNGLTIPAIQVMVDFAENDECVRVFGPYLVQELDHCWLLYKLANGNYANANIGEKPGFVEFCGKPVLRWSNDLKKWCMSCPTVPEKPALA